MNQMSEVLKKIKESEEVANTELETIDLRLRPGWAMRIGAAKEEVGQLTNKYKDMLISAIKHKIFIIGDFKNTTTYFNKLGELGVEGLAVDAASLYRRLADQLAPTVGLRGDYGVQQYRMAKTIAENISAEFKEIEIRDPAPQVMHNVSSYDELYEHIKSCWRSTNSDRVNVTIMNKRILKQAMTLGWDKPTVLFVKGASRAELPDLSVGLYGGTTKIVEVNDSITVEWVKDSLKDIIPNKQLNTKISEEKQ